MIATSVKNLILCCIGLVVAMPSIVIPNLVGIPNEHNRDEFISITPAQASWIGKQLVHLKAKNKH